MTEQTTGNSVERNGHKPLRDLVAQYRDVEQMPGKPVWWADCPLPGCDDKGQSLTVYENEGDEPDWFVCSNCRAEGSVEDFERFMQNHRPDGFRLTDLGNAERLIYRHGKDLHYIYLWNKWLAWDGKRWRIDAAGEVERLALETVRSIYNEAADASDADERKRIAHHAERSEARSRVEAMIALARALPGVSVQPDELDTDPWVINVSNGTIDLRTGKLRPHRRDDLITKIAPVEYISEATAPRFEQFLREVLVEDDVVGFVRRFAGYSLTGSTRERVFSILWGIGKNGKTTLVELLRDALGDYSTNTDTETILRKRYSGVGNDVAALRGARFVSAAEVEQGRALAESKVKNLTGRDTVTARFLFAEPFEFRPEFKLWLSTNNKPVIHGTDDAIWDRIRLVPFTQRFEGDKADAGLPEKLREELPGVLAWMVRGCLEWQRDGLGEPERVRAATAGYRAEMDTLAAFIEDECVVRPEAWIKFADLYAAYTRWCEDSNEGPEKKRRFGTLLTERGFEADNGAKNVAIRRGIALRSDDDPDPARVNHEPPETAPRSGDTDLKRPENVNQVNQRPENVNPENTCKTADFPGGVNQVNLESKTSIENPPRVEGFGNTLTDVNSLTLRPEEPIPTVLDETRVLDAIKDTEGGPWRAEQNYRKSPNRLTLNYLIASLVHYWGGDYHRMGDEERAREDAVVLGALMLEEPKA